MFFLPWYFLGLDGPTNLGLLGKAKIGPRLYGHLEIGVVPTRLLNIGADVPIRLNDVQQDYTLDDVTDAVVTGVLKNAAGTQVGSNVSMTMVGSSDPPDYAGTLPAATTVGLTEGATYTITVTAVSPTKGTEVWTIECTAQRRGEH